MATTVQIAAPARTQTPLALWHLLSLDAPTVAALWTWFLARSAGIHLPIASPIAMALAVWIIYAADRLLDALRADRTGDRITLEARHRFHDHHRRAFTLAIAAAVIALCALLPLLDPAALRLYCIEGALLAAWFLILHATHRAHRLPKEIAVGIFFSAAVFIPTIARDPTLREQLAPAAVLFAALCSLNCLFIYAWEHHGIAAPAATPHPTTRFALRHLSTLAFAVIFAGSALVFAGPTLLRLTAIACTLSAVLLFILHRSHLALSRIHLRAAADLALLTPLLLLPLLPHLAP